MKFCPCGSQKRYLDCCGACIVQKIPATTPEALMRSRYTAFVEGKLDYIKKTMRGEALLNYNKKDAAKKVEWLGLEIIKTSIDPENPTIGYVEFKAHYQQNKQIFCLHENSKFNFIDDKWYYVSGQPDSNNSK